jgi:RNA polymerase sigma-70 factor (ECF subfamily)
VWRRGVSLAQLEALYRRRYDHFVRVAAAVIGDGEQGRDAVQAAFAVAIRKRRSFRGTGPLEAWLWRIVVNEARRLARQQRVLPLAGSEFSSADGQPFDRLELRSWVAALPDRQRTALFLRYFADLDYRTIADLLGVEVGTVSATLSSAQARLRRDLTEVEHE